VKTEGIMFVVTKKGNYVISDNKTRVRQLLQTIFLLFGVALVGGGS